jgi:hypothetical protein
VLLLPSYEHSLSKGHAGIHGIDHLLGLGTDTDAGAQAFVDAAHAAGAVFVLNHPSTQGPSWRYGEGVGGFDAVEVYNGPWAYDSPFPAASNNADALAFYEGLLARGERPAVVGGSDSHWASLTLVAGVGEPSTHVLAPERTVAGVLAGLRARHTFVTAAFDGPSLLLEAVVASGEEGIQGDVLASEGEQALVTVRVDGGAGQVVFLDTPAGRQALGTATAAQAVFSTHVAAEPGAWALALLADPATLEVTALTSPVFFAGLS